MLEQLKIRNYALIEDLDLEFSKGLIVFTGETGAGKSIIIEALGLALGWRSTVDAVRKGASKLTVDAVFESLASCSAAKPDPVIKEILDEKGDLILTREIDISGKSRAYCNSRPVTVGVLSQLGESLVDVHGQNEHQTLLKTSNQMNIVDVYGKLNDLRQKISNYYAEWNKLAEEISALKISTQDREKRIDLYSFQLKEIEAAALKSGEEEEIDLRLPQIKNSDKLMRLATEAGMLISNPVESPSPLAGEGSACDEEGAHSCRRARRDTRHGGLQRPGWGEGAVELLEKALINAREIERLSEGGFAKQSEIENLISQIKDVSFSLRDFTDKLHTDPDEVDRLISRKDLILKLKKKYGPTVEDIISYKEKITTELEKLSNSEENIQALQKKHDDLKQKLFGLCKEISEKRQRVGDKLQTAIEKEIKNLGMPKAHFKVKFDTFKELDGTPKITSSGWDTLEFLFSPNIGEELKPLKDIASGGEMSRVMLALKTVLGAASFVPVMIFDEIDAGVSGPMGRVIGEKLSEISSSKQVFCITHLPQIASFAASHFKVSKYEKDGRTCVSVKKLNEEERIEEIARMLSGEKITASARTHALELLKSSKKVKMTL